MYLLVNNKKKNSPVATDGKNNHHSKVVGWKKTESSEGEHQPFLGSVRYPSTFLIADIK